MKKWTDANTVAQRQQPRETATALKEVLHGKPLQTLANNVTDRDGIARIARTLNIPDIKSDDLKSTDKLEDALIKINDVLTNVSH